MTTKRGDTAGRGTRHKIVTENGDMKKNIVPKELVAECEAWRNRAESEKVQKF